MLSLLVGRDSLRAVLDKVGVDRFMDRTIRELTAALARFDPQATVLQPRAGFVFESPRPGVFEWMPVMQVGESILVKLVSYLPQNPGRHGLPTILATMALFDYRTGQLLAVTDGALPTSVRTGAASAVASRVLADPDSRTLGLVGCGAQAVTQLHALSRVFALERVLAYDTDPAALQSFAGRVSFVSVEVVPATLEEVEAGSDIICTATTVVPGAGPVIGSRRLRPSVHINAVGSDLPGKTELPLELLKRSLVCCDFVEQALHEGEAQQLTRGELGPSLPELVKHPEAVRDWRGRPTVFDSTGFALEDYIVTKVLLDYAEELGLGERVQIESHPPDPKDPYSALALKALSDPVTTVHD